MIPRFSTQRGTRAVLVFALAVTVFAAACSKGSNTGNSSNTSSATKPASSMSPTETMKAYYEAAKKKDIDAVKKFLSRGTTQMMEDIAKAQGKTLDQMFKENADRDANMPTPEFSNEKVSGDTATVDIKAPNQPLITMEMVKEDGAWKLAIDKMRKNAVTPTGPPAPDMGEDTDNSDEHEHENP